ncbi:hypothetical protein [Microbulbifer sp. THAF38]|uniref:hypothetical protein n=1 Tax=Microbulbifer sp. THAF38 TaxID=2587856 RepID=UPI00126893AE|nr:hypothetical protein [Microbulbifer sp. THAF38]
MEVYSLFYVSAKAKNIPLLVSLVVEGFDFCLRHFISLIVLPPLVFMGRIAPQSNSFWRDLSCSRIG